MWGGSAHNLCNLWNLWQKSFCSYPIHPSYPRQKAFEQGCEASWLATPSAFICAICVICGLLFFRP